ncbi:AbrB/MazE/SpoVT family DNA-binding domain-containing protein [Beggiatoa alba]|nr:AbrB/MazE/SpoVT family DNA-binding domain-containing protein [Beggiatoa alba]
MKQHTRDTAAVFMSGTSQAVRLPKQYRFNTSRVLIEKQGDTVILTPAADTWADLCKGKPEDVQDWLQATSDDDLGSLEERATFK